MWDYTVDQEETGARMAAGPALNDVGQADGTTRPHLSVRQVTIAREGACPSVDMIAP